MAAPDARVNVRRHTKVPLAGSGIRGRLSPGTCRSLNFCRCLKAASIYSPSHSLATGRISLLTYVIRGRESLLLRLSEHMRLPWCSNNRPWLPVRRLFSNSTRPLGCKRIRTAAYHRKANSLVERLHWQLKATLPAEPNRLCSKILSSTPLSLRSSFKE